MKKISTSYLIAILVLAAPTAALAQAPNWSQQGDYYAPGKTIVQVPTRQELNEIRQGDYYVPSKTIVRQPR